MCIPVRQTALRRPPTQQADTMSLQEPTEHGMVKGCIQIYGYIYAHTRVFCLMCRLVTDTRGNKPSRCGAWDTLI
jgi:hypothetical protein